MSDLELPVSATHRLARPVRSEQETRTTRPRLLITGSAGVIATALARDLHHDHDLIGLDVEPVRKPEYWAETHKLSVADRAAVIELTQAADVALHLATGARSGWDGLRAVDIEGTRNVLDGAIAGSCRRVILASSNHVGGWYEVDRIAGIPLDRALVPSDIPRPDGLYGAAKTAMEALGRAAAEYAALPVSALRIGSVRLHDDPDVAATEPDFGYIGDVAAVRRRLDDTWLYHRDLARIIREEICASETFRLRYAISRTDSTLWSVTPLTWSAPRPGAPTT